MHLSPAAKLPASYRREKIEMSISFFQSDEEQPEVATFDSSDPVSIYDYSAKLIGQSLRSLLGDGAVIRKRKGKGGLGQMVEELFFGYDVNSKREADFREAGMELKCTPLLATKDGSVRVKERLVCTMIDYFEIVNTKFEESHLLAKCKLMLLLFYLHVSGVEIYDLRFLYRILWNLPDKDLLLIKKDYETIAEKVRKGEAHLLSEGDTIYLGACRKGQKGDIPQPQPYSEEKAPKRAFSLKPAYMRYILSHVLDTGKDCFSNYTSGDDCGFELVSASELKENSFEQIIHNRFNDYIGLDFIEICNRLGIEPYQAKSKYADVAGLIASNGQNKRIADSEEFKKSGIVMKTVRLSVNGMPREAMSFKNIDYQEVFDNGEWTESEAYEIFTGRFLFVVFKPVAERVITVRNNKTGEECVEQAYLLDKVFFWTMPAADLLQAREFWEDIRKNVLNNDIKLDAFWHISDRRKFHVRPKAGKKIQRTPNPNGGDAEKYCYWFNADYVKNIIDKHTLDEV